MDQRESVWQRIKRLTLKVFPERQLFLRSEGRVRFLTIPTPVQIAISAGITVTLVWQMVATVNLVLQGEILEEKDRELASMTSDYRTLSSDFSALEAEIERRAARLEERQALLEELANIGEIAPETLDAGATPINSDASQSEGGLEQTENGFEPSEYNDHKPSAMAPTERRARLMARLQRLNQRQISLATEFNKRTAAAFAHLNETLTSLKLDSNQLLAGGYIQASGGPFEPINKIEPVFSSEDSAIFDELIGEHSTYQSAVSLLPVLPVGKPATDYFISSNFGPRRDPINGRWSRHSGIDIAAWKGTPVTATAGGKIIYAGWKAAYGNVVDIEHGNGFKTRYGHMDKLHVKVGETVEVGHHIGNVGNTGRVTGIHLHFEVWLNGQLQDPLPYLKARKNVYEIQERAGRVLIDAAVSKGAE